MKLQKNEKKVARNVAKVLQGELKNRANSASCCLWYEPKAPVELERFKK